MDANSIKLAGQKLEHYYLLCRPVGAWGLGGHETPQILTDQLTLSQQGGTDYAHHITTGPLGFLDLPTAL